MYQGATRCVSSNDGAYMYRATGTATSAAAPQATRSTTTAFNAADTGT